MKDILISYIVPVYNAEKYVEKCVRSIMRQRAADIEIILINDGSSDSSGHICDLLSKEDSRIQVIHQENKGHGEARNVGIAVARGKWISFVDDDDWLEENTQELCIPYLNEGTDVVLFGKRDIYRNRIKEHTLKTDCESVEFSDAKDLRALQNSVLDYYYHYSFQFGELTLGVPWGKYIRASLFVANECSFVEGYGEDRPCLFLIFYTARKVVYLNEILYNYRIHTSTMRKYLPNAGEKYNAAIVKMHEIVGRSLDGHSEPGLQKSLYAYDIANFSYFVMQDLPKRTILRSCPFFLSARISAAGRCGTVRVLRYLRRCALGLSFSAAAEFGGGGRRCLRIDETSASVRPLSRAPAPNVAPGVLSG